MKYGFLTFMFIFLINSISFGQSFLSIDKVWNVERSNFGNSLEVYKIDGDSLINSILYDQIWASFDSIDTWSFQGLLREDSNIVYYKPPTFDEGVLYNFNLNIGDSAYIVNMHSGPTNIPIYITDIDTIEYLGIPLKRWYIDGYSGEYWVDGIGSLFGPLHTKYYEVITCPSWILICCHQNSELLYLSPYITECFPLELSINYVENSDVNIRPNPVKQNSVFIIEMNSVLLSVEIINSIGVVIKRYNSLNSNVLKVKTNNLISGMYIIRIKTNNFEEYVSRIVVL